MPADAGKVYTAEDWNPMSWDEVLKGDAGAGYRGSKKFAEKAGPYILPSNITFPIYRLIAF
jgi:hypothetical protein